MTIKLSESQRLVLAEACKRDDGSVFPVTTRLKGNAAGNVLKSLLGKGLLEEVSADRDDNVWRHTEAGPLTLRATRAAFDALGEEPADESANKAPMAATRASRRRKAGSRATAPEGALMRPLKPKSRAPAALSRTGTKQAQLIDMLKRKTGATVEEIVAAFAWQPHTVRGAIAGALKKKLGLKVESEKIEGRGRVYRIAD